MSELRAAQVAAYLAEHPDSNAVDMWCAHVIHDAAGTLSYLPVLRRLARDGVIERSDAPTLHEQHVAQFPGAHLTTSGLCVEQGIKWRLA